MPAWFALGDISCQWTMRDHITNVSPEEWAVKTIDPVASERILVSI